MHRHGPDAAESGGLCCQHRAATLKGALEQSNAEPEPTPLQIDACLMNPIPIEALKELRSGHERFLCLLGCADSRVPVELRFDTGFGDLFVVRNAGTMSTSAISAAG
jgi:hypothetical protein